MNSAQGNPLISADEGRIVSAGNFDAVGMSAACDFCRIALAPALTSATERSVKLLQATASGLTPGLAAAPEEGDDALAELAVTSQSLAIEARMLAQPVSFELVSTSTAEGIEDRTSMAALSARRLGEMVTISNRILAIALTIAAQAVDLRLGKDQPTCALGRGTRRVYEIVRESVDFTDRGEAPPQDLGNLEGLVREGMPRAYSTGEAMRYG